MKTYRGPEGDERLWFEPDEIAQIFNSELHKSGLQPDVASPVVDVERFVEVHLRAQLDLNASLPEDVLGQTEFGQDGASKVYVNGDLTGSMEELESPGSLGRWRATLAHEAAHIVLHGHLFYLDSRQGELFGSRRDAPKLMRCLKRAVSFSRRNYDWREVQANMGMATLLMPGRLFTEVAMQERKALGLPNEPVRADSAGAGALTARLASIFQVSRVAASIRLATTGVATSPTAQTLSSAR